MRYHTETRENKNIDFWVTEKPEEMLVKKRITSTISVIETSI
jgi:hypothetical protein